MINGRAIPNIKRIALLRANSLGDFIFTLPAIGALRQTYPQLQITYLGLPWHRDFLWHRPNLIDRVIAVPQYHGVPHENDQIENTAEVDRFFENMQAEKFDIAFQMHGGGKHSNPFVQQLGADLTIGFQAPGAPSLDINVPYILEQHEVLRYLELVSKVGASTTDIEPTLPVTEQDKRELYASLGKIATPYAILHPGASEIQRQWAPGKFAKVGDRLVQQGLQVLITGSDKEQQLAKEVIHHMQAPARNLCGLLSLNSLVALLADARLVIANDTGPLHVARAVKTPNIGIFWAVNALTAGASYITKNRACIAWDPYCPLCGEDCYRTNIHHGKGPCAHQTSFVNTVTEEEVIEQALHLLAMEKKESLIYQNILSGHEE